MECRLNLSCEKQVCLRVFLKFNFLVLVLDLAINGLKFFLDLYFIDVIVFLLVHNGSRVFHLIEDVLVSYLNATSDV